jgi:hypothetical protein
VCTLQGKAASVAALAVLLTSVLVLTASLRAAQASGTVLYVDPAVTTADPGESFAISVNIQDVEDLFSYEAKIGFENIVIEAAAVEEGPFIRDQTTSPIGTFFLVIIEADYVHVACVTQGNYSGVSGSGTLFTVTFNVVNAAISDIHIHDSILLDSNVTHIPHSTADGLVQAAIPGDVNGDGIVNVLDLTIVSLSFGSFIGEPDYNPQADLNHDGIVDMKDLSTVAINLGKTRS